MAWTIQDLGALGELIGALAVVATLAYLAIQIRHQTRESQAASINSLTEQWNDAIGSLSDSPDLGSIWTKGMQDEQLVDGEMIRFWAILSRLFRIADGLYLQYQEDRIATEVWQAWRNILSDWCRAPGVRAWWPHRRNWYTASFQRFIDELIEHDVERPLYFPLAEGDTAKSE